MTWNIVEKPNFLSVVDLSNLEEEEIVTLLQNASYNDGWRYQSNFPISMHDPIWILHELPPYPIRISLRNHVWFIQSFPLGSKLLLDLLDIVVEEVLGWFCSKADSQPGISLAVRAHSLSILSIVVPPSSKLGPCRPRWILLCTFWTARWKVLLVSSYRWCQLCITECPRVSYPLDQPCLFLISQDIQDA